MPRDLSPGLPRPAGPPVAGTYPENPVLARVWRGAFVESQHRGAWVLADTDGRVVEGVGDFERGYFARSSIKCLQALPLLESGAAERFGFDSAEVALAVSSHNAEPCHTQGVERILARVGLGAEALQCGPQAPGDPAARRELERAGAEPSALHNNCSGKHAGFLALSRHLGAAPAEYLAPEGEVQRRVRQAVADMTGAPSGALEEATDGCSAPTFRLPLCGIATAFARVANPDRRKRRHGRQPAL